MTQKARIGVLGAGLMGHGIAQVFALAGHEVRIYDPVPAALETVRARIAGNLRDLDEDEGAAQRVAPASTIAEAVGDADFVVEAAHENLGVKQALFAEVERHAPAQAPGVVERPIEVEHHQADMRPIQRRARRPRLACVHAHRRGSRWM